MRGEEVTRHIDNALILIKFKINFIDFFNEFGEKLPGVNSLKYVLDGSIRVWEDFLLWEVFRLK